MQTTVRFEYEDYLLFSDDDLRHEIIDGAHYVTPAPGRRHQHVLQNLNRWLDGWVQRAGAGHVYFAPFEVQLSQFDVVQPDLVYCSAERERFFSERGMIAAPDLVVEVLSPSTRRRDQELKLKLYERFGVAEYWMLDPEHRNVAVRRLEDGRFERERRLTPPAVLSSRLVPGLEIPVASLFD